MVKTIKLYRLEPDEEGKLVKTDKELSVSDEAYLLYDGLLKIAEALKR